ncbi:MAG: hypothetical protein KIT31_12720 [Deltaproteobacteria bacterium]|nr:hypothetical protein [Deltaproteobacteria bacterium]
MFRLAWVGALLLTGCFMDNAQPDRYLLPSDAHYVAVFAPFSSPEDCLANAQDPRSCAFALTFCADGQAARRMGDVVESGDYYLEGSVANASYNDGVQQLRFDVDAVVDLENPTTHWIVDDAHRWETLAFDTISCSPVN